MSYAERTAHDALAELQQSREHQFAHVTAQVQDRIDNPHVALGTLDAILSSPSSAPMLASEDLVRRFENAERSVTAWVESYYTENYYTENGPDFLPAHLLFGSNDFGCFDGGNPYRRIVAYTAAAYHNFFSNGPVDDDQCPRPGTPVVYSTSRPGKRWCLDGYETFGMVLDRLRCDVWCDLNLSGTGNCVKYRYPDSSVPLPFAHGDLLIIAHTCHTCWARLLIEDEINPEECKIVERWTDGF